MSAASQAGPAALYPPDIIAAVATAPGRGGIGVVRVSGHGLEAFARALLGFAPAPRHARYVRLKDLQGDLIDAGIALWFAAPHSFTGEDVLEFQGHGGPVVLNAVLEHCLRLGARPALPGEFSQRAFLNGKLDLAQAEAIADLIDAGSRQAARSALRALEGEFSRRIHDLRETLTRLRMLVEASLDFPEEDIDLLTQADVWGRLERTRQQLASVLASTRHGQLLREGLTVVLVGQPNTGKSSLLNQLAGHEAAIVTDIAGTTRDALRQAIQIDGIPLNIIDTAGLRETEDPVERLGIQRTWAALEKADIALLLTDAQHGIGAQEAALLARLNSLPVLTVHNKIDLTGQAPAVSADGLEIWLSAKHDQGLDLLRERLLTLAGAQANDSGVWTARSRHIHALQRAAQHLDAARASGEQLELLAEELRLAQDALGEITGKTTPDDLLGRIFSEFCIGK